MLQEFLKVYREDKKNFFGTLFTLILFTIATTLLIITWKSEGPNFAPFGLSAILFMSGLFYFIGMAQYYEGYRIPLFLFLTQIIGGSILGLAFRFFLG